VRETCGPAKPADISLNIQCIFVRAGVGGPVTALIPKQLGDGRIERRLVLIIGELLSVVIAHDGRKRPKRARMPRFLLRANGSRSTFIVIERSMPIADSDGMQRA
jgi:hypothetical protein